MVAGLSSLVELKFNAPPGTSYSYITIHLIGTTEMRLMGVPTTDVGYTSVTAGKGDHEVHKGHVVVFEKKFCINVCVILKIIVSSFCKSMFQFLQM
jgi:hypothetical protein